MWVECGGAPFFQLTSEGGVVDSKAIGIDDPHVSWYTLSALEYHQITHGQLCRGDMLPRASIANDLQRMNEGISGSCIQIGH